jgi:hypothetical protein
MPGKEPELVSNTIGGNGTTFDLQGRLVVCEGDDRCLTRMGALRDLWTAAGLDAIETREITVTADIRRFR